VITDTGGCQICTGLGQWGLNMHLFSYNKLHKQLLAFNHVSFAVAVVMA